jgi:hypothetical protein
MFIVEKTFTGLKIYKAKSAIKAGEIGEIRAMKIY